MTPPIPPHRPPLNGVGASDGTDLGSGDAGAAGPPDQAGPDRDPSPTGLIRRAGGRNPRKRIGWALLAVTSGIYVYFAGVPYSSDVILLWITAFLFVSCLDDAGRWRRGIVRDWLPLYLVLVLYDLLRGYASHPIWGPFVRPQAWFDAHLFGGVAPTLVLQRWLYDPGHLHVWDYAAWATYTSHFFTSFVIAGVLWKKDYERFRRFVPLFVGLTLLGYLTYVLYPAMPPWMASQTGHLGRSVRIVPIVWDHVGLHLAAALFTGGNRFDNNIAAMPSLHAAYPMLICLFFWRGSRAWVKAVLALYVLAMAFSVVYGAEHFVIDVFVGWAYAVATFVIGSKLLDRWEARRARRGALGTAVEHGEPDPGPPPPDDRVAATPDEPAVGVGT